MTEAQKPTDNTNYKLSFFSPYYKSVDTRHATALINFMGILHQMKDLLDSNTVDEQSEHQRKFEQLLEDNFQKFKTPMQTTRQAMINEDTDVLIVCSAALSPKGKVIASVRHGDELFYEAVTGTTSAKKHYHDWKQGFVTNRYSFVTRSEAWIIAERQGQIRNQLPCDDAKRLYSENLY